IFQSSPSIISQVTFSKSRIVLFFNRRFNKRNKNEGPFQKQLDNFVDCIEGHAVPTVDGKFGKKSVFLIEEMYKKKKQMNETWVIRI
ncbi:unnamed protein product, partial [marine sediment metagenome]